MANDAIVRFHAESSEYDNKLKKAIDQMQRMEQEVRRTGASFAVADKEELEFVRSLGQMQTQANSAKGQMREFTEAILTLTQQYRNLSEEERNGDHGRALAESIATLKGRAADLQDTIGDLNEELKHMSSDTSFADGMNLMTRTVGSCAAAITAWTGDSKEMEAVIKDLAKIGTTVAAVEQLTKAVQKQNLVMLKNPYVAAAAAVVALGVAIGKLIKKSQELSAVDKALQDVQQKGRENSAKEITRIDTLNNILHDNTRSLEERKTALAEIQNLVPDYHGALTEEGNLINDNTGAIDDYIDSLQRAAIAQAAFDKMVELQKKKMEEQVKLQEAQAKLDAAQSMASAAVPTVATGGAGAISMAGATAGVRQGEVRAAQNEVNSIQKIIDEQDAQINALRDLVKSNDIGTTGDKSSKPVGTVKVNAEIEFPEGSAAKLKQKIAELQKQWSMATTQDDRDTLQGQIKAAEEELAKMTPEVEQVADMIRDAAAMWGEHTEKIADIKARIAEFQAMMNDMSLSQDQRDWAAGMADAYQDQLDKMTGATEEAVNNMSDSLDEIPTKFEMMQEALDNMSTGVGAISTVGNAFNELKGIGEDLTSAFSGEMNAWDSLMKVFNSGIGIMQTVMGVMEAINTLQELSNALSDAKVAKQAAETTAVVSGKGAEAAAEYAEAAASGTATAANAAEAAAGAGKAMAGIPIVGPVLAVASIAAVLAAVLAATSKAKSAGKFASGGIIPGNSFSGDNLTANVNSGELILNKAQQDSVASQLQNNNPIGNMRLYTDVSGKDLRIVLDNDNRSQGGSRGAYSRIR